MTTYDKDYFEGGEGTVFQDYTYENYLGQTEFNAGIIRHYFGEIPFVDLGCGKGFLLRYFLEKYGISSYGIELSDYAYENREHLIADRVLHGDFRLLENLPEDSPKILTAFYVLEHLKTNRLESLFLSLNELNFTRLLFSVPLRPPHLDEKTWYELYEEDKTHVNVNTLDWWNALLYKNGWTAYDIISNQTYEGGYRGTFCAVPTKDWETAIRYKEKFGNTVIS